MKYKIIYADPPWEYRDKRDKHPRLCGGATKYYKTMTIEDIKNIPIKDISDDNCILFLWATFPNLPESLEVIKSWGFTYKTLGFSWIKTYKESKKPFFGIGHYTKSNCEVCLIGVKGRPPIVDDSISSVFISSIEKHSKKPDEIRRSIVKLCGNGLSKIELFARKKSKGWDYLGFDIDGKDINDSIKEKIEQEKSNIDFNDDESINHNFF